LNGLCLQAIDLVHQHGGDVMRFAGDSIICSFSATKAEHALADKGLAKATSRSVHCAAELSFKLGTAPALLEQSQIQYSSTRAFLNVTPREGHLHLLLGFLRMVWSPALPGTAGL